VVAATTAARLRRVPLLGELPTEALELLVASVEPVVVAPGDRVIVEGSEADKVYVVVHGDLVATRGSPPRPLARLGDGAFFGEMALLDDTPRSATVTAVTDAELLALPRTVILDVCEQHPAVLGNLLRALRARLIAALTATSPLFSGIPQAARAPLVARFRLREIAPDTDMIREGRAADGLYIVLTGRADVRAGATTLTTLTTGDVAGELSLLSHGPSDVTVRTRSWVTALVLAATELEAITTAHPPLLAQLARVADARRAELAHGARDETGRHGVRSLRRV
jgi:CRP-like cAMP-binding protein